MITGPSIEPSVELSILTSPHDIDFFEITTRHLLRGFAATQEVARRSVVIDLGADAALPHPASRQLLEVVDRLQQEALIDRWLTVEWSPKATASSLTKWYGDPQAPTHGAKHRVIYPYLACIDSSECRFVLHLDSDVLYHSDGSSPWLGDALGLMRSRNDVAAVIPMSGVPQASSGKDWLLGSREPRPSGAPAWNRGTHFTSRHFLIDRDDVESRLLPRTSDGGHENWETAMSRTIAAKGLFHFTDLASENYFLHPHRHNTAHSRFLPDLIGLVEEDRWPYRRWGHPWDITTEGRLFLPWLALIAPRRLRASLGALRHR